MSPQLRSTGSRSPSAARLDDRSHVAGERQRIIDLGALVGDAEEPRHGIHPVDVLPGVADQDEVDPRRVIA